MHWMHWSWTDLCDCPASYIPYVIEEWEAEQEAWKRQGRK